MPTDDNKKRIRSPAYPFINLEEAIHYARRAYDQEDRHAFTPEAAAVHWDFKSTSSAVSQIISALKQFGLLVEEPGNGVRRLRLSPLALDLMVHEDGGERGQLLKTAALGPKIHREIWEKYSGRLPSDTSLKIYLLREREVPFNKDFVDKFISQLRETIEFAKLTVDDKMPVAEGAAGGNGGTNDEEKPEEGLRRQLRRRPMQPDTKEDTFTLENGQVIVQWPDNITQEEYEDLEAWFQIMIRKVKRSVRDEDTGEK